jgi:hypothetical protein
MDTATFYATASALSFTLLGFWWIVVEFRHDEMTVDPGQRRLAFVVSLHFVLPGLMSLAALLTGDLPVLWRITFATAGIVGMVAVVLAGRLRASQGGAVASVGRWIWMGIPLYAIITIVALDPNLVRANLAVEPLQVEGSVMTLLVALGIMFAWVLFTEPRASGADRG